MVRHIEHFPAKLYESTFRQVKVLGQTGVQDVNSRTVKDPNARTPVSKGRGCCQSIWIEPLFGTGVGDGEIADNIGPGAPSVSKCSARYKKGQRANTQPERLE